MAELTEKKNGLTAYPFLTVISLFLMFGLKLVLKPWATVTEMGVNVLGVYLGVLLMLICTKESLWPPIMGMFALVVHGYKTGAAMLQSWMGNSTVMMLLFILAICGALKESKAPLVLANFLMTRKINKGHPCVFLFMLFIAATILSMLTSGTAAILIMYQVADGLMEACGYDKDSEEHRFILLGIYIANIGSYMLPFKGVHLSTLAVATGIMKTYGIELNNALYLFACCATVVIFLIIYILMMKFVFRCNLAPLGNVDIEKVNLGENSTKFNTRQAILMGTFVLGIVLLLLNSFLPKGGGFQKLVSTIGNTWIWIFLFVLLCIPHMKNGKSFIDGSRHLRDNAMWATCCMIACISLCGQAISSDELGIKQWLLDIMTPILGNMSFFVMVAVVVIFCTVMTQFLNGSPIAFVLNTICIPFACQLQLNGAGNATSVCSAITFCCFFAFVTPAASSLAPLITGHQNMTSKFLWTKGWIYTALWCIVAILMFFFFGLIMH